VLGAETEPEPHPIAQYSARDDTDAFAAHGTTITITAQDMELLDKDSLELIQMYEDSMQQRFDRITIRSSIHQGFCPTGTSTPTSTVNFEISLSHCARI